MRKPKLAFELLSLLARVLVLTTEPIFVAAVCCQAFEFTDFEDAGTTNEPDCRKSRPTNHACIKCCVQLDGVLKREDLVADKLAAPHRGMAALCRTLLFATDDAF